jgi:hypothetical protein
MGLGIATPRDCNKARTSAKRKKAERMLSSYTFYSYQCRVIG